MREHIKAPEKIQLSDQEIANLSDAQFKTLVIRMLTELVEFGHKIDEKMKAMLSEIKENAQGANRETRTQINSFDQKKERNIQLAQNEETRIQKKEESLQNLCDKSTPTSKSLGCQKEKRKSNKLKTYLNK